MEKCSSLEVHYIIAITHVVVVLVSMGLKQDISIKIVL